MKRKIILAKTAGFCMGVSLALRHLDKAIANQNDGQGIYTFGPIIHNPQVLDKYKKQGVHIVESPEFIKENDIVVIRAHGISKNVENQIKKRKAHIIDATCPKVKHAQILIAQNTGQNIQLLLYGERNHPEVQGLISYAQGEVFIFENLEELKNLNLSTDKKYLLAAQTTQDRTEFQEISDYLHENINKNIPIVDTICNATRERQDEVLTIAAEVECFIIVGGHNSGNTRRLGKVAELAGLLWVHVEEAEDLPFDDLKKFSKIAISAGASTPLDIIEKVKMALEKM